MHDDEVRPKIVLVNDLMQRGYRYELVAPAGRDFDPRFSPELTPEEMLRFGVFGGKYLTDCTQEFPGRVVRRREAVSRGTPTGTQLLRREREPAAFGVEATRLDPRRRPSRLVPVVLPVLDGPKGAGRGRPSDRALACVRAPRGPGASELPARRGGVSAQAAASAHELGVRQPEDLAGSRDGAAAARVSRRKRARMSRDKQPRCG